VSGRIITFAGGNIGAWQIIRMDTLIGEPLPPAERLALHVDGDRLAEQGVSWRLRGAISHHRYVTRAEQQRLAAVQPTLGRAGATCAALLPIRKNAAWWALPQDERRAIFEEQSAHIALGLRALPVVARPLHQARDQDEPVDFMSWVE
jgi:hypothetical protein